MQTEVMIVKTPRRSPEQLKRHREHMRMCRLKDPQKFRERSRKYSARPDARDKRREYDKGRRRHRLVSEARKRAKERGIPITITVEDVAIPEFCPVLGIPILFGGPRDNWPSLDRFDNSLGYVPTNIFVISNRANRLKSDAVLAEVEAIARYMRGDS